MNNEMDNQSTIVELVGPDGSTNVELVFYFTDGNREFMVANNVDDENDTYILEYVEGQDGPELVTVDDPEEFKRLSDVAIELIDEQIEAEEAEEPNE